MRTPSTRVVIWAIVLLWGSSGSPAWSDPAPQFKGLTTRGDSLRSSDFGGRVVLVDFWATWCPSCRKQLPQLAELEEKVSDLVVITICVDQRPENIRRFRNRVRTPDRIVLDLKGEIAEAFDIPSMPWSVLIDANGEVVWSKSGMDRNDYLSVAETVAQRHASNRQK